MSSSAFTVSTIRQAIQETPKPQGSGLKYDQAVLQALDALQKGTIDRQDAAMPGLTLLQMSLVKGLMKRAKARGEAVSVCIPSLCLG